MTQRRQAGGFSPAAGPKVGRPGLVPGSVNRNLSLGPKQEQILDLVGARGYLPIETIAEHFSVTPQTARRWVNDLCELDLLRRYHGGVGMPSSVENVAYSARKIMLLEEKRRIARLVARQIPDKASLFLNIGTTIEEVAKALLNHAGLRVVTNNLNVAQILSQKEDCEVSLAGGMVRARDGGIIGPATLDFIGQFKMDFGVIGISGIDPEGDLLDYDYREVRVARAIMANSRKVFLVADHTKFARKPMVRLAHASEVTAIFTDQWPAKPMVKLLKEAGVVIHVAEEMAAAGPAA
ncbi:MAG: DeoR family transcriptional regulator [Thermodesulfobacteriota bacterium]